MRSEEWEHWCNAGATVVQIACNVVLTLMVIEQMREGTLERLRRLMADFHRWRKWQQFRAYYRATRGIWDSRTV